MFLNGYKVYHLHVVPTDARRGPLEAGLQKVVSCCVGSVNKTWVLC